MPTMTAAMGIGIRTVRAIRRPRTKTEAEIAWSMPEMGPIRWPKTAPSVMVARNAPGMIQGAPNSAAQRTNRDHREQRDPIR